MTNRNGRHRPGKLIAAVTACVLAWAAVPQARAVGPTDAKPLELRKIMEELGRNMQAITDAISKEEWARVAQLAPKVASHPEPPLVEKVRILAYLGTDAGKFRNFDQQAHEAAQAMGQAAGRGDGKAVIQSFARVQEACLGCHQGFRKAFVEHFYGSH